MLYGSISEAQTNTKTDYFEHSRFLCTKPILLPLTIKYELNESHIVLSIVNKLDKSDIFHMTESCSSKASSALALHFCILSDLFQQMRYARS